MLPLKILVRFSKKSLPLKAYKGNILLRYMRFENEYALKYTEQGARASLAALDRALRSI
jgi:hypothetical protein